MDVLLVASGKSSRLVNYTKDYLPKYLLNIDNHPALVKIINYWSKYAKRFFLVIHEQFHSLTQFYIDHFLTSLKENIYIFHYNDYDGTAYTIDYIYKKYLIKYQVKNLLISWSDILPKEDLNMHYFQKEQSIKKKINKIHIFTYGNECRYLLDDENKIIKQDEGNIIGIYYIQNILFKTTKNIEKNIDIVEYLSFFENNTLYNYELNDLLDFGDENKYKTIIEYQNDPNKMNCRSFNEINIKNNQLLKKAINEKGVQVIKHEMAFYKYLDKLQETDNKSLNLFPKIYQYYESAFSMEYKKEYINLYKYLKNNNSQENEMIIKKLLDKFQYLHQLKNEKIPKVNFLHDIKGEIYDKIIKRIKNIQPILDYFPKFKKVNGIFIADFKTLLDNIHQFIFQYYELLDDYQYQVIHGDPNFSNILIHPKNKDLLFIDPRGYFSNSSVFGPKDYDYAKILYGLSGYDEFNNHHFVIDSIDKNEIKFKMNKINISNDFKNKHFNKLHRMMVVIIWLGLAEYNKNNIWKCVASYYHGLYLGSFIDF